MTRASTQSKNLPPVPDFVRDTVSSEGRALNPALRERMENSFGTDFSEVRVHTDEKAAASTRVLGARAYTVGQHIVFGRGQFQPESAKGSELLAHELTHTVQQSRGGAAPAAQHEAEAEAAGHAIARPNAQIDIAHGSAEGLAYALDDWLNASRSVKSMSYSEIVSDIDEINQWLSRQMQSTPESVRLEEALAELQAEKRRKEKRALAKKRKRRRKKKKQTVDPPRSEIDTPRVLLERTSVNYQDTAEIHREVDLIMEWLGRSDLAGDERSILKAELDILAPKFQQERQKVAQERQTARLTKVFNPSSDKDFNTLEHFARVVQGIVPDSSRPGVFLILHEGEQIAISEKQFRGLQKNVADHFKKGRSRAMSRARGGFERYRAQVRVNDESPIISRIAGFLGDAGDPIMAMTIRNGQANALLDIMQQQIAAGDFPAAAVTMAKVERLANEIHAAGVAFSENHIRGAGAAVKVLEITRDVSFAIAGSIAAIVAAPVVATAIGGSGLLATTGTAIGTGLTVGTGTAVVRGGSAFAGELAAGNSTDKAIEAFQKEGKRGFKEGVVNGVTGGVAVKAGQALNATKSTLSATQQLTRRAGAEAIGDLAGGTAGGLMEGKGLGGSLRDGVTSAALGVTGNIGGHAFKNPGVKNAAESLIGAGTASGAVYLQGGSTADMIQAAGTSLVAGQAISRAARLKSPNKSNTDSGSQKSLSNSNQKEQKLLTDGGRSEQKLLTDGGRSEQKLLTDGGRSEQKLLNDGGRSQQKLLTDGGRSEQKLLTDGGRSEQKLLTDGGGSEQKLLTDGGRSGQKLLVAGQGQKQRKSDGVDQAPIKTDDRDSIQSDESRGVSPEVRASAEAALRKIDQDGLNPTLHVGKKRLRDIESGKKNFILDNRTTFDIDEPLPVGQRNIKRQRAVQRALDPHNRQLLDAPTNRRTKGLGIDPRDLTRKPREPISLRNDIDALITRRFDEVVELRTIFEQAKNSVDYRSIKKPTKIKNDINRKIRDIITKGQTPEAIAVRAALKKLGFQRVPRIGWAAQR